MPELMQCPLCKAENSQGPTCRRCKAELSLLFTLEEQRAAALARARELFDTGRAQEALTQARRAHTLRAGDDSLRLVAVTALMARDFATAWRCWATLQSAARDE
jgi:hypothetical protein